MHNSIFIAMSAHSGLHIVYMHRVLNGVNTYLMADGTYMLHCNARQRTTLTTCMLQADSVSIGLL